MSGQHSMRSKAQWRFLFAKHKTFARRWAHAAQLRGGYHALPARIGKPTGRTLRAFGGR
jgi:hypothetical protein